MTTKELKTLSRQELVHYLETEHGFKSYSRDHIAMLRRVASINLAIDIARTAESNRTKAPP